MGFSTRRPAWTAGWMALAVLAAALCGLGSRAFAAPVESRFFTTSDGVRLHYLEAGPQDGETMVFVPGWRMPAWIFDRQIEAFSKANPKAFHVVAFDPRGQGESDAPAQGYDPERRGKDLAELIDHLGPKPVLIVAWSLGVLDTLTYVTERGDSRIAGLVLVDNSVGEEPAPVASGAHRAAPEQPPEIAMHAFVEGLFHTPQSADYIDRLTAASLHTPEPAAKALKAYPMPREFWRDAIYSTGKPVLYVIRPRWEGQAANLERKHRSAEVAVFNHAGHALFVDEPDAFDAKVADFVKRKVWP
ncbi:MAG TPA: alpha/beta hydrolase [Caulobacteraceae bacterium]|jgi:microsomal epoxide hydrolase|nr:alpha/beta hydrolase [Caulobacteraceae bacterium]